MRLRDKVALVTGGGSGIGRATALLFAREGAKVVVSDLEEASALEVAQQVKTSDGEATAAAGDVSVGADAGRMVEAAVRSYGRLDVLVNSAGVTARNALPENASPEEVWDRVIEDNLRGTFLVSWYAVPEMERSGGGAIRQPGIHHGAGGIPRGLGRRLQPLSSVQGRRGPVHQKPGHRLRSEEHPRQLHLPWLRDHQPHPLADRRPRDT